MYCLSLIDSHLQKINNLNYIPVGLGDAKFSNEWVTDKSGINISHKNSSYGEYTFHYNLWKNNLLKDKIWNGFCSYRRFWLNSVSQNKFEKLEDNVLKIIPQEWEEYDVVLVNPIKVNKIKFSKILKHGKKIFFKKPFLFFNKKNITIKTHFDMFHGYGNLAKAINVLEEKERADFIDFVNTYNSFNPYNMFICKSKNLLINYYESIFPWLENCEKIFGLNIENSYGKKRIYGFLAERYLSYWFNKYAKVINWPIVFKDIS